jgi:hypothetical protein
MDVVGIATNFYYLAVGLIANATGVVVKFHFHKFVYQWFPVFCAENKVYIIFHK